MLVGVGVRVGGTGVSVAGGGSPPEVVAGTTAVGVGAGCVGVAVGVGGENDNRGTVVALPDTGSTVAVGVKTGGVDDAGVLEGVGAAGDPAGTSVEEAVGVLSLFDWFELCGSVFWQAARRSIRLPKPRSNALDNVKRLKCIVT